MPFFSIIIPCLNEEQYLPRLLTSLNLQQYKNFEVIVVDGHSKDKTPELVRSFPATFPLTLLNTSKQNVSHQRNLGAKKATGKVLIFFDADTQIPPQYFTQIHTAFKTKRPDVLTTWMIPDIKGAPYQLIAAAQNFIFEFGRFMNDPSIFGAMMAFKKTSFEALGGFDVHTKFGEDSQLVKAAIRCGYKFIILSKPKYIFCMRRFKKEGSIEQIYKYIKLAFTIKFDGYHSQKPNYPMGGHVFNEPKSASPISPPSSEFLKALTAANPDKKQDLKTIFETLFPPQKKRRKTE